jgi:glycosyltransferase involved in cell wall biosynthesis
MDIRRKGIYLISEVACLRNGSGAYDHIKAGLEQLNHYFDVEKFVIGNQNFAVLEGETKPAITNKIKRSNLLLGSIKDLFEFGKNHVSLFRSYKEIRLKKVDFIYERSSYLNFNGLIIAKLLGIPHFYEVNGVHFEDIVFYRKSIFIKVIKFFTIYSYRFSSDVFFIGGIHNYLHLDFQNFYTVQNGVDEDLLCIKKFDQLDNRKLKVVFVGNVMDHHGLDFLGKTLENFSESSNFEFYFVGRGFEVFRSEINPSVSAYFLGEMFGNDLYDFLKSMDIGIIPRSFEYGSNVKLFLYGCLGLCVLSPDMINFRRNIGIDSLVFFQKENGDSLKSTLVYLSNNREIIIEKAKCLQSRILNDFTWRKIFIFKRDVINRRLNEC